MIEVAQYLISRRGDMLYWTLQHLELVGIAMGIAVLLGVTLGLLLTRVQLLASPVLGAASVVQTIPSIALLGIMIPLLGIGRTPAVVALTLYALLPIIRNTYTGIQQVDPAIVEAGRGMGMSDPQILTMVELPLAVPVIIAGIRTSTVICVGITALVTLIGAGALGTPIITGIQTYNDAEIWAGAAVAAGLALLLDFLLGRCEAFLTPKGIRTPS